MKCDDDSKSSASIVSSMEDHLDYLGNSNCIFVFSSHILYHTILSSVILLKENNRAAKSRPCTSTFVNIFHIRIAKNNFFHYSFLISILQIQKMPKTG